MNEAIARLRPAILFDLDGTLTDSKPGIINSTLHALRRFNETRGANLPIPEPESLTHLVGPPLRTSFAELVGADEADTLLKLYRERYEPVGIFENSVYPGIVSTLETLGAMSCRLFVATSKPEHYARRIVEHFELSHFFVEVHGAAPDGTRAAKADIIADLLARHGIAPAEALMIGDREHDALGAKANGLLCAVGALWGYGSRPELEKAGAATLVERPDQLVVVLSEVFSNNASRESSSERVRSDDIASAEPAAGSARSR
jgi:phosphoglycolate phosphatase